MCGICGFLKYDSRANSNDKEIIEKMTRKLIHRGPDAQDTLLLENVVLGFTRLSIIGLQDGMQPLYNEDESLVLICNGEIFNYIELKAQLIKKGHQFRTTTDIEVILHLYEEKGPDFLNELNGQFAFALYDRRKKLLFCARDQMGIIPFFYTQVNHTFIFGSEIKAILEHPEVVKEIDTVGLDQVFTFAGLISPRTMFKNIKSLENGHYLLFDDNGNLKDVEYWDLIYPEGETLLNGKAEQDYIDELEALFDESVKLRLRADVPTGFYLSGGLDSSMIAMKVKQQAPKVLRKAFSIDFEDALYSEANYQEIISSACGSVLTKNMFPYNDIIERLKLSVYHSECPIKETYNTASMALSESVRSHDLKVILSGEGADEFFAGYVGYRFDKMRSLKLIANESTAAEKKVRNKLWGDEDFFYERNFTDFDILKRNLYSKDLNDRYDEINCLNYQVVNKERIKNRDVLNKRAYIDYKLRLVDHLVGDHGDRMAMANSVEVRYPFLDKNLIEYSAKIPSELKLNEFTEKYILRKIGESILPKSIMEREKFHFIAPGSPYLLQQNSTYINDLLSYDRIKRQGYFNPDEIEKLKTLYSTKGFAVNAPYESDLLSTVITFGMLLETFM
ncbi:asparagine synthase (glutamine-hydrolysing) [Pedobacter suwonensis]|uniref:asparagine synthase (glutamine-hydrolyzing) n=1 Tax=Pedobacter suwonensis TaxID=332999 RepID=A0A1I0U860_9SPHI|nr:asparagine synthase (glutamine-hydrolyzing) [Pedobacter suwonensis]SFA60225.1 asparagine synthase (glutamine-hydrolysing) [Pedobacter suwonensis]